MPKLQSITTGESWKELAERAEKHPETLTPEEKKQFEGMRDSMAALAKFSRPAVSMSQIDLGKLLPTVDLAPLEEFGKSARAAIESMSKITEAAIPRVDFPILISEETFIPAIGPEVVHVANSNEIGIVVADEVRKTMHTARREERRDFDHLIEYVAGTLRIKQWMIEFGSGLRSELLDFFVNDPGRGDWRTYDDFREFIGDPSLKAAAIREAIRDINKRGARETDAHIQELIQSRPRKGMSNGEREFRFVPSGKKRPPSADRV